MERAVNNIIDEALALDLNIYIEQDVEYGGFAAYCIETGAVATATTAEESEKLIKLLLESDIAAGIDAGDLANLFHGGAPPDVKSRWHKAKTKAPDEYRTMQLALPDAADSRDLPSRRGMHTVKAITRRNQGVA